jgi:hypothetical protein
MRDEAGCDGGNCGDADEVREHCPVLDGDLGTAAEPRAQTSFAAPGHVLHSRTFAEWPDIVAERLPMLYDLK